MPAIGDIPLRIADPAGRTSRDNNAIPAGLMKILLVHNFYRSSAPSGEDTAFGNERALLAAHGFEVSCYERRNDDIDDTGFVKRVRLALESAWSKRTYVALRSLLRQTRPDVAHFHNTFPQITPSGWAACRDAGVPVVQTLHNFRFICPQAMLLRHGRPCELCLKGSLLPALCYRCYRSSFSATLAQVYGLVYNRWRDSYGRYVSRYITLTRFAADKMVEGGLPARRITTLANSLAEPPQPGAGDGGFALYVGRLGPEKGMPVLLKAWRGIPTPLRIVGDGPLRAELESMAHCQGLAVEFLGLLPQKEVMRLVGQALFQVVPSECYEGFPFVVLEAMACGTPVVASRIGSLAEVVIDGITGVKFTPGDADELHEVVCEMLSNEERLRAMRQRARLHYMAEHAPAEHVKRLRDIYADVIHEQRRGCL
jgi:glycosyltransferase involved in cell wall biosynthesis